VLRGVLALTLLALICAGCGAQRHGAGARTTATQAAESVVPTLHARPQAVDPAAGSGAQTSSPAATGPAAVSVGAPNGSLAQPVSNTAVERDLTDSGLSASPNQATLTPDGLAIPPINAPPVVQEIIEAGNQIARLPYRYGGGHVTYEDTAYDCSGSISYVFEAAGLLDGPVVSGNLMNWGEPGPGKWITVFANAGHTFMYVAGLRFDTVALAETGTRWSNRSADEPDLSTFAVRHPPGL
jgi:cell wall-associated NlpC family hydrolase